MQTILYATDYSKNSATALKYAYKLSTKMDAQLKVIHVFHYPSALIDLANNPPLDFGINYFKQHTTKLDQFCYDHLGINLIDVSVEAVENKSVLEGIITKAKALDPLFIVVGTKGMGTLKDLIMGNTTQNLIENGSFSILSIPQKLKSTEIKTIIYGTAFEEDDIHAICKLTDIARPFNANIKVVHISSKKEYPSEIQMEWFKEMLNNKVKYNHIRFDIVESEDVFNSLKIYIDNAEVDLIAMLDRKKGGFLKKLLSKDTVQKMNNYGKYPLISFNISKCLHLNLS